MFPAHRAPPPPLLSHFAFKHDPVDLNFCRKCNFEHMRSFVPSPLASHRNPSRRRDLTFLMPQKRVEFLACLHLSASEPEWDPLKYRLMPAKTIPATSKRPLAAAEGMRETLATRLQDAAKQEQGLNLQPNRLKNTSVFFFLNRSRGSVFSQIDWKICGVCCFFPLRLMSQLPLLPVENHSNAVLK